MNHWPFIIGAYAAAVLGLGGLTLQSWLAMRAAEKRAEELRGRR